MSSAKGILLVVVLAAALSVTDGWRWEFDWSMEEPANCPYNNTDTNVCSSLTSIDATCVTFKCCDEFHDDEDYSEYQEGMEESEEENVYYFGRISECRVCFTVNPCSLYKCYSRCCDGYEEDYYGRCRNKTGHIQCQNGGTPRRSYYGDYCDCPSGFDGKSCEIPKCSCENGGECMVKDGKPYCNCPYGHYGERCEQSRCHMTCRNGGTCFRNGSNEYCYCPADYVGKYCEQNFRQPDTCPIPDYMHTYCASYCTSNSDCDTNEVCCREGCSTMCRRKKVNSCVYNGRQYAIGQKYQPDACTNCTCMYNGEMSCIAVSCAYIRCQDGREPVPKPGECCPSCPEKPSDKPPKLYGCPTGVLHLNTSFYEDYALISDSNTHIRAVDAAYNRLEVKFRPEHVSHCRCRDAPRVVTNVMAYAKDKYGNMATCTFKVAVHDIYPPVFKSCPEDIYVFENDVVRWREPSLYDNVGVAYKTCSKMNGKVFPVGDHQLTYQAFDYDRNTAFCRFHISVTSEDTDIENMPQGLRNRSKDKSRVMLIVAPVVGGLFLVIAVVMMFLCCRRRNVSRDARGQGQATPAYDNNIYTTPGDIDVKLPAYSDLPMNPPAYSITGTEKDIAYLSIAPPSYSNPGYETLKVHVSRSGSVKSNKSEKSEKSENESNDA